MALGKRKIEGSEKLCDGKKTKGFAQQKKTLKVKFWIKIYSKSMVSAGRLFKTSTTISRF
jgi:hypothetical protein